MKAKLFKVICMFMTILYLFSCVSTVFASSQEIFGLPKDGYWKPSDSKSHTYTVTNVWNKQCYFTALKFEKFSIRDIKTGEVFTLAQAIAGGFIDDYDVRVSFADPVYGTGVLYTGKLKDFENLTVSMPSDIYMDLNTSVSFLIEIAFDYKAGNVYENKEYTYNVIPKAYEVILVDDPTPTPIRPTSVPVPPTKTPVPPTSRPGQPTPTPTPVIAPTSKPISTPTPTPAGSKNQIIIHFYKPGDWSGVYVAFRDTNGGWVHLPATPLSAEGDGWYMIALPPGVESTYLYFYDPANPSKNRTPELYIYKPEGGHWYYRGPETDNSGWQDTKKTANYGAFLFAERLEWSGSGISFNKRRYYHYSRCMADK